MSAVSHTAVLANELADLARLLSHLPKTIPDGTKHNFQNYISDLEWLDKIGCENGALNRALEISFGSRKNGGLINFQTRGPALEAVATTLCTFLAGTTANPSNNGILKLWLTDLIAAARNAITKTGGQVSE